MKFNKYLNLFYMSLHIINLTSVEQTQYLPIYKNISDVINIEEVIVVITFNRPNYFQEMVNFLEKNSESHTLPFFFILDGGINSTQKENIAIIENSKIKNKYILLRPTNFGCGKNMIDIRRFIFDWCNFKRAIIIEDDLIISSNYINLTFNLNNWAKKKYDNIGIVQGWNKCKLNKDEKSKLLKYIYEPSKEKSIDLWGYCIEKNVWDKIKNILYEYENYFLENIDYGNRNHDSIRLWIKQKIVEKNDHITNLSIETKLNSSYFMKDNIPTGQDIITIMALYINNLVHIATLVNRAKYIGKEGIHYTPEIWYSFEHDKINLDEFEEDKYLKEFEFIN